jgi:hypothetical protein
MKSLAEYLRRRALRLAAIDSIGSFVTDVNFVSPGLICEMEQVLGLDLATSIVNKLFAVSPGIAMKRRAGCPREGNAKTNGAGHLECRKEATCR